MYSGYEIPPFYDSLVGKIVVHGRDRAEAVGRMRCALGDLIATGIQTNVPLHQELMLDAEFLKGGTSIHYLEQWLSER